MGATRRVLVAGIGNIFLGDDAFGVEVVRRLAERALPEGVEVVDFGIRGFDLACALTNDCAAAILVDATPRGGAPGTLYVIEPDAAELEQPSTAAVETHSLDPLKVFGLANALGGRLPRLYVVGCEPGRLESEDGRLPSLSPPVSAALDGAVAMAESLVRRIAAEGSRE